MKRFCEGFRCCSRSQPCIASLALHCDICEDEWSQGFTETSEVKDKDNAEPRGSIRLYGTSTCKLPVSWRKIVEIRCAHRGQDSELFKLTVKARSNFSSPKQSQSSDVLAAPGIQASPSDYLILERTKIDLEDIKAKVILRMTTHLHLCSKYLSE